MVWRRAGTIHCRDCGAAFRARWTTKRPVRCERCRARARREQKRSATRRYTSQRREREPSARQELPARRERCAANRPPPALVEQRRQEMCAAIRRLAAAVKAGDLAPGEHLPWDVEAGEADWVLEGARRRRRRARRGDARGDQAVDEMMSCWGSSLDGGDDLG